MGIKEKDLKNIVMQYEGSAKVDARTIIVKRVYIYVQAYEQKQPKQKLSSYILWSMEKWFNQEKWDKTGEVAKIHRGLYPSWEKLEVRPSLSEVKEYVTKILPKIEIYNNEIKRTEEDQNCKIDSAKDKGKWDSLAQERFIMQLESEFFMFHKDEYVLVKLGKEKKTINGFRLFIHTRNETTYPYYLIATSKSLLDAKEKIRVWGVMEAQKENERIKGKIRLLKALNSKKYDEKKLSFRDMEALKTTTTFTFRTKEEEEMKRTLLENILPLWLQCQIEGWKVDRDGNSVRDSVGRPRLTVGIGDEGRELSDGEKKVRQNKQDYKKASQRKYKREAKITFKTVGRGKEGSDKPEKKPMNKQERLGIAMKYSQKAQAIIDTNMDMDVVVLYEKLKSEGVVKWSKKDIEGYMEGHR